jgi:hypothetical protein
MGKDQDCTADLTTPGRAFRVAAIRLILPSAANARTPQMAPFRLLPAGLEEAQFKRVPEGWLFTTPSPWVFAPRRTYLVTDAQKPALAARVRRARYLRLILMIPMMLVLVAVFVRYPTLLNARSVATWLGFVAFIVVFTVIITLSDHLCVRPLLHDLPRSVQKIGFADMMRRQSAALSVKALAIFTAIFVIAAVANAAEMLMSDRASPFAAVSAFAFALFAIAFLAMLVLKLRARREPSSQ